MRFLLLAALALAVGASRASAHGGQYRPPSLTAGSRDTAPLPASWQTWWEYNREPFVRRTTVAAAPAPATGPRANGAAGAVPPAPFAVVDDDRDRIVPALLAALAAERSRDVQTACMVALAKIRRDGGGTTLEAALLPRLQRDDTEVRETAALALGIAGRPAGVPHLLGLVRDDAVGRKLVDGAAVPDRVRTFAVYGLALAARRSADAALQQQAAKELSAVWKAPPAGARDLRVAAVLGLGALHDPERPEGRRLAWQLVDELLAWLDRDLGAGEEIVQAQAPIAIARLLGRGDSAVHARCKRAFAAMLTADSRRGNALLQSAAIALGAMALPAEQCDGDAHVSAALRTAYDRGGEPHVRLFAAMALARIGGNANRSWLLGEYPRGNKTVEKPWLALALGVYAQQRALTAEIDPGVARLLRNELAAASYEDLRAPLALAVGLTRDATAVGELRALLADRAGNERTAGYACTALGLLGDRAAIPDLAAVMTAARRQPFVLQAAALALGQLGDRELTPRLVELLAAGDSLATLVGLATAIGRSGDRRAIDPLLAIVGRDDAPQLSRAFAAAALGWLADTDPLPWNRAFAVDANYACEIDTLANGTSGILDIL
jgi:HEAT repeat protein